MPKNPECLEGKSNFFAVKIIHGFIFITNKDFSQQNSNYSTGNKALIHSDSEHSQPKQNFTSRIRLKCLSIKTTLVVFVLQFFLFNHLCFAKLSDSHSKTFSSKIKVLDVSIYQMYTVAGNGASGDAADGAVATSSSISKPQGVFIDKTDSFIFLADFNNRRMRKINLITGITNIFAGDGTSFSSGDGGPATSAPFLSPVGVAGSTSGVIYISDFYDSSIRAVDTNGIVTKVIGSGASSSPTAANGDGGPASSATLNTPSYISTDSSGNLLIADSGNNKIRKIDFFTGKISTIAGTGSTGQSGDIATSTNVNNPVDVSAALSGKIYISVNGGARIRVILTTNIVTLFAGSGATYVDNAPATSTIIGALYGVWVDTVGNVYFADLVNKYLRVVPEATGIVNSIAGTGTTAASFVSSGPALSVALIELRGVRGDSQGRVFVTDFAVGTGGSSVRGVYTTTQPPTVIPTTGPTASPTCQPSHAPTVPVYQMYTVAGNGVGGNAADGAVAASSSVNAPHGLFIDTSDAVLYLTDYHNLRVRKVNLLTGITNYFAGDGTSGSSGDGGAATSAKITIPFGVAGTIASGVVYFSDLGDHKVRAVNGGGIISSLVGISATPSVDKTAANGDGGAATSATVNEPYFMTADTSDNLYFCDYNNFKVRKVDSVTNIISTIAGTGGGGASGNGFSATSATMSGPIDVFVSLSNKIYITHSNVIRRISNDNIIMAFAGLANGATTYVDNVPATSTGINGAYGLWGDSIGNIFFSANGAGHNFLRVVSGFSGIVTTIGGSGATSASSFVPNGPALSIPILSPRGLRGDSVSRVYLSEISSTIGGNCVRGFYANTEQPTVSPTSLPSVSPTQPPTQAPTTTPSGVPSCQPTRTPSMAPIASSSPTYTPSNPPTVPVYQMYTVAGNGVAGNAADGDVAASAAVSSPYSVFVDTMNTFLYCAEFGNYKVRKINLITGITNKFAGDGTTGITGDNGSASSAKLNGPRGVVGTTSGVIYICDYGNNRIRVVSADGIITKYAGTGSQSTAATAANGDGSAASSATLYAPQLIALDASNNLYIADFSSHKVRKVDAVSSIISTIAGTGTSDFTGDGGFATSAILSYPVSIFVDNSNQIFITEYGGNRIRVISTSNIIRIFAGLAQNNYFSMFTISALTFPSGLVSGDSTYVNNFPATSTGVYGPRGVWGDTIGNVFYTSYGANHNYLRMVSGLSGIVTSIAGTGGPATEFIASGPALSISVITPNGVYGDSYGRIFVSDSSASTGGSSVRGVYTSTQQPTISPTTNLPISSAPTYTPSSAPTVPVYQMYTVAGNGVAGSAADGEIAAASSVNSPAGLFVDGTGTFLYLADSDNRRVRKINLISGITNVYAGDGSSGNSGDKGRATSAEFTLVYGVAGTTSGVIFVGDNSRHTIRAISTSGIITAYAGTGVQSAASTSTNGDGAPASSATLNYPNFIAVDSNYNLYIADRSNHKIRKVNAVSGIISTIAGTGDVGSTGDGGYATSATLNAPGDVFINSVGVIYIAESSGNQIRMISADNIIALYAGSGSIYANNVPATSSAIASPFSVWGDTLDNIYFTTVSTNFRFLRMVSGFSGIVNSIAGTGASTVASFISSGSALSIAILEPRGVRGNSQGRIFVTDISASTGGSSVRGIYANTQAPTTIPTPLPSILPSSAPTVPVYQMYTVAGNGARASAADGAVATSSSLDYPHGIFIDSSATLLYVADNTNMRIRKINMLTRIGNVFAGDGTNGNTGNGGAATSARFSAPVGVVGTTSGTIYISDIGVATIRVVSPTGIINKLVGSGSSTTATAANGDGGAATSATVNYPFFLCLDSSNNLYFADSGNNKIRKIDVTTNKISTIVGTGEPDSWGDNGFATSASVNNPCVVFIDSLGSTYVTELYANRIRKIAPNNIITLFAGLSSGDTTLSENVPATSSGVNAPYSVWVDTIGNVFIGASGDQRVRIISSFSGIVTSIAGSGDSGSPSYVASGPALSIPLPDLRAVWGDFQGKVYVSDLSSSVVRAIYASTQSPTTSPTSVLPTVGPTTVPTISPTKSPTKVPTNAPTLIPTSVPTHTPSMQPSQSPTTVPTEQPTQLPTISSAPSFLPSSAPTVPVYHMYTVAGNGVGGNSADGDIATSSSLYYPHGLFVDSLSTHLFVAEFATKRVRKVNMVTGITNVLAGDNSDGNTGNGGAATSASFNGPVGVVGTTSGSIYISDYGAASVRVVDPSGIINKVVDSGASGNPTAVNGDGGPVTSATVKIPYFLCLDSSNNLYIADSGNNKIRKIDVTTNIISTIVGTGGADSTGDGGHATSATVNGPLGVIIDIAGYTYIAESGGNRIRVIAPNNIITFFAGLASGDTTMFDNVPATSSGVYEPYGIWVNTIGDMYIGVHGDKRVRVISSFSGIVATIAGTGGTTSSPYVNDGAALSIPLTDLRAVWGDSIGKVYVSEVSYNAVRAIFAGTQSPTVSPTISAAPTYTPSSAPTVPVYQMYTVAGNGIQGTAADGDVATSSSVHLPYGLFLESTNTFLYFVELNNRRVCKLNLQSGIMNVFAGNGTLGNAGDGGSATSAMFVGPIGVVGTTNGVIYVGDNNGHTIRAIGSSGIISTYAGTARIASDTATSANGDGGPASSATLKTPYHLALDSSGNLYFVDNGNNKVRKIEATNGIISTIVGTGVADSIGDYGYATAAALKTPRDVFIDTSNRIFVTETGGHRIRMVSTDNIITLFAGLTSGTAYENDVPATSTGLESPTCLWGDTMGNVYFNGHYFVRMVSGSSGIVTSIAGTGSSTVTSFVTNGLALDLPIVTMRGLRGNVYGTIFVTDVSVGDSVIRGIYTATQHPTDSPTAFPSVQPTVDPSAQPSIVPTAEPSSSPVPSMLPSVNPTAPTLTPTQIPTISPAPTYTPSSAPTVPVYQMYTVAGNGAGGTAADGAVATSSSMDYPHGIFVDSSATLLYVADMNNRKVRKINMISGITNVFAGSGSGNTGNGGAASSASFSLPIDVVGTTSGSIYISDNGIATIRVVTPDGIIQKIVDSGASANPIALNGDGGAASSATVKGPYFLCLDSSSNLFIADSGNNKIRKIDAVTNIISTIAGTGAASSLGDGGYATSASIKDPSSVFIDITGNTYIAENGGNRIRVISTDNIITLFAGLLSGSTMLENVPATSSSVTVPFGLWVDTIGNVYFCVDTDRRVRVVSKFSGMVVSIAGGGSSSPSYVYEGPALSLPLLSGLRAVWGDLQGKLYVSQRNACVVRAMYASTQTPTVSPTVSEQPSVAPTCVPTASPSKIPTVTPTTAPSAVPTTLPTTLPSATPTIIPTTQPTILPTISPSSSPTNIPTVLPSETPTIIPSNTPTIPPTVLPSVRPTDQPSALPSETPTTLPSVLPTTVPSSTPTITPTVLPSLFPTDQPSALPSVTPTIIPSLLPSESPSEVTSGEPSAASTITPFTHPTLSPSFDPTEPSNTPSFDPTLEPSQSPTITPTEVPISTTEPSQPTQPSHGPSVQPTETPTVAPCVVPSVAPSIQLPSVEPTHSSSGEPSPKPLQDPILTPTEDPSYSPSYLPSLIPSLQPSTQPTVSPSVEPTQMPSVSPSTIPTLLPSNSPSFWPTEMLTETPTTSLTTLPTLSPTMTPSLTPIFSPSAQPSTQPTSVVPSGQPSFMPSSIPTPSPSKRPQTVKPTAQINTFPTETGLSMILPQDSSNRNLSVGAVIVLPFLRVAPASNSLVHQGFYDIDLSSSQATVGTNYVVYVNRSPNRPIDLNALSPNEGFQVSPAVSYDYSGRSVSNAGDINGDGYDDLIIGVPYAARCYLLFGTARGFVNMTEGFTIFGQADSMTGWSVSGAGDVNNDTFADIIIGSPYARDGSVSCGAVYVIFGSLHGHPNIHLQTELLPEQGFAIYGATQSELLGLSVSSAGDVNNDGFDDVIIGALKATSSYRGGAYVVYGTNSSGDDVQLNQLSTSEGFSMSGPIWSYSGYSVSGAGDVNGDGYDDVLIGSVPFRTTFGVQTTYLIYGNNKTVTAAITLSATSLKQQGIVISGGGVVVSGVEDINHDNYDDIMISSNYGFTGGGFVTLTYKDTYKAPTIQPTILPTTELTAQPTILLTRQPTTAPSTIPTREPTQRPSRQPTVQQSGPSEPPSEAPTGPTFTPSSMPSISTEHPSSCPTTSFPSSRPSTQPTSRPSIQPSRATDKPTQQPTSQPITSVQPTSVAPMTANPAFRSRNPVIIAPTIQPSVGRGHNIVWINSGGVVEKRTDWKTHYIINTNETIVLQGVGFNGGNIYTVLPHLNGSLHIEIFNNISDKLNLTSHSTIHSMSDLIITSGSVIITFPTTGQRIRLANLTPLDISENNFIFAPVLYKDHNDQTASRTLVFALSSTAVLIILLFIAYQLYRRSIVHKQRMKHYQTGTIKLEDNPTRLIVAVNDMYAHFDAYTPSSLLTQQQDSSHQNNNNSSDSIAISAESKSNENSPLNSFETHNNQNNKATNKRKEQTSSGLYSSGDVIVSSSTISGYDSSDSSNYINLNRLENGQHAVVEHSHSNYSENSSKNSSQTSLQSRQSSLQSDFNISMDSDILNEINHSDDHDQPRYGMENYNSESGENDEISLESDMISQV